MIFDAPVNKHFVIVASDVILLSSDFMFFDFMFTLCLHL